MLDEAGMGGSNVACSFACLFLRPGRLKDLCSPVPIWSERFLIILGAQISVIVASLALTFHLQSRKSHFV